jgi:hippurate hydrolase
LDGVDRATARAFALHITAAFPNGTVNTRPGSLMAAPDSFEIEVIGRGGHASEPYRTVDPIPVAAEIVMALQAMVTRRVNVFDPAVLTVASIHAGTTHNVIPDSAGIQGTIRTLSAEARAAMEANLRTVVAGVASAHGATAEVVVKPGYPATHNDPGVAAVVGEVVTELFGEQALHILPAPRMGGEDFSYVLNEIPGAMAFLGGRPLGVDPATAPMNHSSRVVFDESVMARGVALNTAFALRVLDAGPGGSGR